MIAVSAQSVEVVDVEMVETVEIVEAVEVIAANLEAIITHQEDVVEMIVATEEKDASMIE